MKATSANKLLTRLFVIIVNIFVNFTLLECMMLCTTPNVLVETRRHYTTLNSNLKLKNFTCIACQFEKSMARSSMDKSLHSPFHARSAHVPVSAMSHYILCNAITGRHVREPYGEIGIQSLFAYRGKYDLTAPN